MDGKMDLLIFSDSHGRIGNMVDVMERLYGRYNTVIHLGDNERDAKRMEQAYPSVPFYAVAGNCDFNGEEKFKLIGIYGKRIFITHGHEYGVKSGFGKLKQAAAKNKADACLFGHTHEAHYERVDGMIIMNPGSIEYPRGRHGTSYAMLTVSTSGDIRGNVIELTKNGGKPIYMH